MKASGQRQAQEPSGLELFLRIKHPAIDSATITQTMGLEPDEFIDVGTSSSAAGVRRVHSESYWIAQLKFHSYTQMMRDFPVSATAASAAFLSGARELEVQNLIGGSEFDFAILSCLRRLQDKQAFFRDIYQAGGSVTLLIQRNDQDVTVSLRNCLPQLAELGIAVEID